MIAQEQLHKVISYDKDTGHFTWLKCGRGVRPGRRAGTIDVRGYEHIRVEGRTYKAHRLVWLYVHGSLPEAQIDHVNGDCSDNRLCNLRAATNGENQRNRKTFSNSTTGVTGVSWNKRRGKYEAYIKVDGKRKHLGLFDSIERAAAEYSKASKKYHGEFARNILPSMIE